VRKGGRGGGREKGKDALKLSHVNSQVSFEVMLKEDA